MNISGLVNDWSTLFSLIIEKLAPLNEMPVSEKYRPWIDKYRKGLITGCILITAFLC